MQAPVIKTASATRLLWFLLLLTLPAVLQAQYTYTTNRGTITITGYIRVGGAVTISNTINGLPISNIGSNAFYPCTILTKAVIPTGLIMIDRAAFYRCAKLPSINIPPSVISIKAWR
ncbi:MAG: leucine-rich repeat protein [Verrucomicrobia subdivision 3 bacterium]|nr:leucine-rich repeat protein [Limisphaerales bacterium]